jgi:hypothetical protein
MVIRPRRISMNGCDILTEKLGAGVGGNYNSPNAFSLNLSSHNHP